MLESLYSCSMRGVSGDDPEAEQEMAFRGCWLVTNILGRFGKPARQALRPGCEELRCTAREEMPEMEARDPDLKSPWWSAERRASRVMGRRGASQAPRPAALLRAPPDAAASGRLSALRPPLVGVEIDQAPGANAPRERFCAQARAV
jgi:hypothetical protein